MTAAFITLAVLIMIVLLLCRPPTTWMCGCGYEATIDDFRKNDRCPWCGTPCDLQEL